ncbi:hypothetical protein RGQ15_09600 [Paracoccus sp. MBLB3053]|uniref:Uncharacterized protein n=1 Tax=Paracoccus aurantius TaxID=3073814 RepID=A0ABU2HS22_9RHOB|nr:hypothetical protein [Paracoccus sp. MBLB3053]MDS9467821.1 hypothetical protein [Paracoccus sp. MBLB3053]
MTRYRFWCSNLFGIVRADHEEDAIYKIEESFVGDFVHDGSSPLIILDEGPDEDESTDDESTE